MRRLWGRANSSNVMKVIWLLEELGLAYERLDVGGAFGKTDTPEYRAMNPNSLVPTLEEDGFVLWESNAILRYLCESNAQNPKSQSFWPRDPRTRANIDRWMDWQQATLNSSMTVVFWGLIRTPPEKRDMAAIERAAEQTGRMWGILDRELSRHAYVGGEEFTLADIPLGVHVHRWFSFEIAKPEAPHLRAWYDRLRARPAYARHIAVKVT